MTDEIDGIVEREAEILRKRLELRVTGMVKGESGECDLCGEWSGRLVNGVCAPCRDRHGLP